MTAAFGTCPKHHIKYRGRCPKCHPRRSSSRPVSGRRQHALILDHLVRIESPQRTERYYVTTATFTRRWLDRAGIPAWGDLTDAEYAWLLKRSSDMADRWNRMFGQMEVSR